METGGAAGSQVKGRYASEWSFLTYASKYSLLHSAGDLVHAVSPSPAAFVSAESALPAMPAVGSLAFS